jgi:hypothetical protein
MPLAKAHVHIVSYHHIRSSINVKGIVLGLGWWSHVYSVHNPRVAAVEVRNGGGGYYVDIMGGYFRM